MTMIKNKWALITGASRGIGQQIALGLAQKGVNLVLHSSDISNQAATLALLKDYDIQFHQVAADLNNPASIASAIEKAEALSGGIDIVYNNAALMTPFLPLFETPPADYAKSFQVNVLAVIQICNFFAQKMRVRGFGRIVNITSGIKDTPHLDPYSITKAALDKYTRDLAVELGNCGVLANLVDPGWCRTDLGGPNAFNDVRSVLPGILIPALLGKIGDEAPRAVTFSAQNYAGVNF